MENDSKLDREDREELEAPPLREVRPGHLAARHFSEALELKGVTADQLKVTPAVRPVR